MLYTICIALILVASVLIILAVLVQNPKSGMAANFGASNQVMGVRETAKFMEKFTWTMAIAILVLSLVATLAMDKGLVAESNAEISKDAKALQERVLDAESAGAMPQAEIPAAEGSEAPAADEAAQDSLAAVYADHILHLNPDAVLCQGECTFVYRVVQRLEAAGIPTLAACSRRKSQETTYPDGSTLKRSIFAFAGFRRYGSP